MIAKAIQQMITFYQGNTRDIDHFMKVWAYAKAIGELEHLDTRTQETLELAAIVHDIACPLCRKKYGSTLGTYQEQEGIPLTREFFQNFDLDKEQLNRICFLVGHHHTLDDIQGFDYQILVEADFIVNASEKQWDRTIVQSFKQKVFQTKTGKQWIQKIFEVEEDE